MDLSLSGEEMYGSLGVRRIINASGTTTMWGGSKLRPEAAEVMRKTADVMVDLGELNRAAGKVLAEVCGAEAGVVVRVGDAGGGGHRGERSGEYGEAAGYDGDDGRDHHS